MFSLEYWESETEWLEVKDEDGDNEYDDDSDAADDKMNEDENGRIWNYLKMPVLDPKCAKLDQKSGFWRLVSVSWSWGNPQGGSWGNPGGPRAVTAL